MKRSQDWLAQADYDLKTAKQLGDAGSHAWACFVAQQAAEKALKAALEALGLPSWGHDLVELLEPIASKAKIDTDVDIACRRLNLYYVATRYPDAFSSGAPADKFSKPQSASALEDAKVVIEFARKIINR